MSSAPEEETSVAEDTDPNTISLPEARLNTPETIRSENPDIPEAANPTVQKAMEVQATPFSALQEERSTVEEDPLAGVTTVPQVPWEGPESASLDQVTSEEATEVPVQEATHESATLLPVLREETPKSRQNLVADIAVVPEISCNEPESAYPDHMASVEVTEILTQEETDEAADLFPIFGEEIPTSAEDPKDDIVTVSEVFSDEQKNAYPDQSIPIEVADVPAQGTAKESAETSSVLKEDMFPAVEAEGSNTAESESFSINPESACLDQPSTAEQEPLVQEETAHIANHPPIEEKRNASSSNESENNIVFPVAANHEIAELSPPAQIHDNIEDELQTKNPCNQTILSSELVLCDIGNLHWSESGENTFTLWENDTTGMSGNTYATISIQRKETISFPGVQNGLDWEPLALHAARLVMAPFCSEQSSPSQIIETAQSGLVLLTCKLQKDVNTGDIPIVIAAFTNRTSYLLTGTISMRITAEEYVKSISLRRLQNYY